MYNLLSRKVLVFIFLATFAVPFSSCKNKNKAEAAEFFERGNYHFQKREYERAVELFSEAIDKVPDFADAYNNRGSAHEKLGNTAQALSDFSEAVALDDTFEKAKLNLALAYLNAGETEAAIPLLDKIKNSYADSSSYHDAMGLYYLSKNNATEAINSFNNSLKINANNIQTVTNKGFAYYQNKNYSKALEVFKEALEIDKEFGFANNDLSAVYAQLDDFQEALVYSTKAVENDPTSIVFLNTHILNLLETNQLDAAEQLIVKAEKIDPENAYVKRNKAVFHLKKNNPFDAAEILQNLINDAPDVEFCYYYYGVALQQSGKRDEACRQFKRGVILKDQRSESAIKTC